MTFWLAVAIAYIMIIAVGLALGVTLSQRYPGGGRKQWDIPDSWQPDGGGLVRERENA